MRNIGFEDYESKLEQIKFKELPVLRTHLRYGIQPAANSSDLTHDNEFSKNRINKIAERMIKAGSVDACNPPKVVFFKGTPVIVDGHHTVRAIGIVNSCNTAKGGFRIEVIKVAVLDLNHFLSILGIDEQRFQDIIDNASISFKVSIAYDKSRRGYSTLLCPQVPMEENLGTGIEEQ